MQRIIAIYNLRLVVSKLATSAASFFLSYYHWDALVLPESHFALAGCILIIWWIQAYQIRIFNNFWCCKNLLILTITKGNFKVTSPLTHSTIFVFLFLLDLGGASKLLNEILWISTRTQIRRLTAATAYYLSFSRLRSLN